MGIFWSEYKMKKLLTSIFHILDSHHFLKIIITFKFCCLLFKGKLKNKIGYCLTQMNIIAYLNVIIIYD